MYTHYHDLTNSTRFRKVCFTKVSYLNTIYNWHSVIIIYDIPPEINLVWVQSPLVDHAAVTDEDVRWCTLTPGICVLNAIIFIRHSTA